MDVWQRHAGEGGGGGESAGLFDEFTTRGRGRIIFHEKIFCGSAATVNDKNTAVLILREGGRKWERVSKAGESKAGRTTAELGTLE